MRREERLEALSDRDLDDALLALVAAERVCVADILFHLAEVDVRGMYVAAGYGSLFAYATEHLGMTRAAAGHRITAARLVARFPVIRSMVAAGEIHVAGLKLLSPYLMEANHRELLSAAAGKSKRAIEEMIAARYPRSDVLPLVVARRVSGAEAGTETKSEVESEAEAEAEAGAESETGTESEVGLAKYVREARPLSADSYAITFTIDRACKDKLAEAQALLSHRAPSGDPGAIMSLALDALLAKVRKQRFSVTDAPRAGRRRKPGTRYIPAEDNRAVWERDGERCAFVSARGKRCTETRFLEKHHVDPHGKGGPPTAGNLQMVCRVHNSHYAEADYGEAQMARAKPSPRVPEGLVNDAKAALRQLGFGASTARRAVTAAAAVAEPTTDLQELIRAALRHTASATAAREPGAGYRVGPGAPAPPAHPTSPGARARPSHPTSPGARARPTHPTSPGACLQSPADAAAGLAA